MLSSTMRGKPLVYLDNAATSLTPTSVIDALNAYYNEYGVNIHRGIYELSERATREYEQVRLDIAAFLNSPDDAQVIFTHGCTESANLVAYSWGRKFLAPGDVILTSEYEHHSSLVPWHAVCAANNSVMDFIPIQRGTLALDMEAYKKLLNEQVKILVLSGMSNVTGYVPPLKEMIALAHANGTVVVLDGAQLVSHCPVDVQDLNPDFLFFSAHKMLGPTGVGVLWAKKAHLDAMDPFMYGGDMILKVSKNASTYHPLPQKFEAGTPNIAGVLGFGQAIAYLKKVGMANIARHEQRLMKYLKATFADMKSLTPYLPTESHRPEPAHGRDHNHEPRRGYGGTPEPGGIFSFNVDGIHSHDIGALLDAQGIAVRTGFHCAMPLMDWLGVSNTVRSSFYFYNNEDDVDALRTGIEQAQKIFSP